MKTMTKIFKPFLFFIITLFLVGCAQKTVLSYRQELQSKVKRYEGFSRRHLLPYFERARVEYPPHKLAFLIFKATRKFELYAKDKGRWHYIRTFPVLAASGGPGPKLHSGDHQVPEGIYKIIGLNPDSRFDLSMHLNYPNAFDLKYAARDHRRDLGGNIFIHGNRRSIGCIAIGNYAIQQIFPLVAMVGFHNVKIIIAPVDFRIHKPIYGRMRPQWLPILYRKIRKALQRFPEAQRR